MKNTLTYQRPFRYPDDFCGPQEQDLSVFHVETVTIPAKWDICDLCDGEGTHVNPAIDAGGLSQEDFEQDPSFTEAYFNGIYDVPCRQCGGTGKMLVPVDAQDYIEWNNQRANDRAEAAAERRMAARENGDWESYSSAGDMRW